MGKFNLFNGFFNFGGGIILLSHATFGLNWDVTLGLFVLAIGCGLLTIELYKE